MNETKNSIAVDSPDHIEIWDNSKRAKILIVSFCILTGLSVIGIISGYFELKLLKSAQEGQVIEESVASANDLRQMVIGLLQTALYIISAITFIAWFRRAYGNLHRLGIHYLKQKETMAVWSWFIPIIVLFRPVQIMNEIWTETQEKIKKLDPSYAIKNGGVIIGIWWTLFIISNFIGRYILKTAFKTETIAQLIESSQAMILSDLVNIFEAFFVILIVFQLSKMESKLAVEIKQSGGKILHK